MIILLFTQMHHYFNKILKINFSTNFKLIIILRIILLEFFYFFLYLFRPAIINISY